MHDDVCGHEMTTTSKFDAEQSIRDGARALDSGGEPRAAQDSAEPGKLFTLKLRPPPVPGKLSSFKTNEMRMKMGSYSKVPPGEQVLETKDSPEDIDLINQSGNGSSDETVEGEGLIKVETFVKKEESSEIPKRVSGDTKEESTTVKAGESMEVRIDKIAKVLVVGNAKCGKSSIIDRYTTQTFDKEYKTTIGADFVRKDVYVQDPDEDVRDKSPVGVRMQLWDIAGQDRFQKLTRAYFQRAKAVVIVCDVSRGNTVEAVAGWKREIDNWAANSGNPNMPVVLFANKSDLLADATSAFKTGATMERMCRDLNFLGWWITSAKTGESLDEGFYSLLQAVLRTDREAAERKDRGEDFATSHNRRLGRDGSVGGSDGDKGSFKLVAPGSRARSLQGSGGAYDPYANQITDCC